MASGGTEQERSASVRGRVLQLLDADELKRRRRKYAHLAKKLRVILDAVSLAFVELGGWESERALAAGATLSAILECNAAGGDPDDDEEDEDVE